MYEDIYIINTQIPIYLNMLFLISVTFNPVHDVRTFNNHHPKHRQGIEGMY